MRRGGPRPEAKRKWAGKACRTELLQVGKGHSISEISVLAEDSWGGDPVDSTCSGRQWAGFVILKEQ
jgi:hypothetical protein